MLKDNVREIIKRSNGVINANNVEVRGDGNKITGPNIVVHGHNNEVDSAYSEIHGNNNMGSGMGATLYGRGNVWFGTSVKDKGRNNKLLPFRPTRVVNSVSEQHNLPITTYYGANGEMFIKRKKKQDPQKKRKRPGDDDQEYVTGPTKQQADEDKQYDEDKEDNPEKRCGICLDNICNTITMPCKHVCLCCTCARQLCFGPQNELFKVGAVKCPECREHVTSIEKFFV